MTNRSAWLAAAALILALAADARAERTPGPEPGAPPPGTEPLPLPDARGRYAVLITERTARDRAWRRAAEILREKYGAALLIVPDDGYEAALPALRRLHPRYTAIVAQPDEIGRSVVVRLNRMMRRFDGDPYEDTIWGIVTGHVAADAQRIAALAEPLRIASGFSSMGPGLPASLGAGFASHESNANVFHTLNERGEPTGHSVTPDAAGALAAAFRRIPVDVMHTSGHATERDWQIGYEIEGGQIRSERGRLFALDRAGRRHDFSSPNPKVYLPMGNCLIGHIPDREALAAAWMHSGGVVQMFGYAAVTFYGFMGWGVRDYFRDGSLTFSQSVHANRQALLHRLHTRFPDRADLEFPGFDARDIQRNAVRFQIRDRDLLGLLWDRDTVAFYGDPAWVARMPAGNRGWTAEWSETPLENGRIECLLSIRTLRDGQWGDRPLVYPLLRRIADIRNLRGPEGLSPVVTDDMVLIPLSGGFRQGERADIRFEARPIPGADTRPVRETIPRSGL